MASLFRGRRGGVFTNQDFTLYTNHFYNFKPRAGWTFVADGACDPVTACQ